jgi:hypothetical protein
MGEAAGNAGQSAGNAAQTASGAGNQASGMGGGMASSMGGMASSAGQALTSPLQSAGQMGSSLTSPLSSVMSQFSQFANPATMGLGTGMLGGFAGFGGGAAGPLGSVGSVGSPGGGNGYSSMMASMGQARSLPSGRLSVPSGWGGSVESGAARPLATSGLAAAPVMNAQPETFGSGGRPPMGMAPMMAGMGNGGTGTVTYAAPLKRQKEKLVF